MLLNWYLPNESVTVPKLVLISFTLTPAIGFWVFLSRTHPDSFPVVWACAKTAKKVGKMKSNLNFILKIMWMQIYNNYFAKMLMYLRNSNNII